MPDDTPERDEFTGVGGSYIRDPLTGKRTPAPAEPPADADPSEGEQE